MIAMLVLQNAPRFRMFVAGWYFRFARAHEFDRTTQSFAAGMTSLRNRLRQKLIGAFQQMDVCRFVQGVLVAVLVLLLVC